MADIDQPKEATKRGPLARPIRVVLVLVLLAVVGVGLLPTILSTAGFRNRLITTANRHLGGTVELDDWQLGWTSKSLSGLRLWPGEAGVGEPLLDLSQAEFEMDILPLLFGNIAVRGELTEFQARLVIHEDGSTSLEDFFGVVLGSHGGSHGGGSGGGTGAGDSSGGSRAPGDPETVHLAIPGVVADLSLRNGSAMVVDESLGLTTGVENLAIEARSKTYDAPIDLTITADVRVNDVRSPFELHATAFGSDNSAWSLGVKSSGLEPGRLASPLLAAAFPLLAGGGDEAPVVVRAPLDLDLALSGSSLEEIIAGVFSGVSGTAGIGLGEGGIDGGVFGQVQEALGALQSHGIQLPGNLAGASSGFSLDFHGFRGNIAFDGGRLPTQDAALADGQGGERPLPIEGYATLDGQLHYSIPWTGLTGSETVAKYLGDRALSIVGPYTAPDLSLGLDGILDAAMQNAIEGKLAEAEAELAGKLAEKQDELKSKVDEAIEEKLGGKLDLGGLLKDKLKKP